MALSVAERNDVLTSLVQRYQNTCEELALRVARIKTTRDAMLAVGHHLSGGNLHEITVHDDRLECEDLQRVVVAHDDVDMAALGRDLIESRRLLRTLADIAESLVDAGISHYGTELEQHRHKLKRWRL